VPCGRASLTQHVRGLETASGRLKAGRAVLAARRACPSFAAAPVKRPISFSLRGLRRAARHLHRRGAVERLPACRAAGLD